MKEKTTQRAQWKLKIGDRTNNWMKPEFTDKIVHILSFLDGYIAHI